MEESDKATALKKAYAEIILNTAKESAARVMVSDRKSAQFHHDLFETKEEALRLLVRLKQMIDAKTIEAEITSSNQQQQIDVLEAQLQEAEDIITDLRSELRWVRDEVEKARVTEMLARNVVNKEEETISAQKSDLEVLVESLNPNQEVADTCLSVMDDSLPYDDECGNDENKFEVLSVNTLKGCDASELDADIISKKLELSRNGCTQRIHALARTVLAPSENEEEQGTTEKDSEENLSSGKVNRDETSTSGSTRCLVLGLRARNAEVITNPLGIKKTSESRKVRGRRKRKWGKQKATSVRSKNQLIKPCQSQSELPCSKTSVENSDDEDSMETHLSVENEQVDPLDTCKVLDEHLQKKRTLHNGDMSIIHKGKRSKKMKNLVEAYQESDLVSINADDSEYKADIPENETSVLRLDTGNVDQISESTNVHATNQSTDKDLKSRKEEVLVNCEGEEDSVVPSGSNSKVTAVLSDPISESTRTDRNRLVKYTFQRKRKKRSDD